VPSLGHIGQLRADLALLNHPFVQQPEPPESSDLFAPARYRAISIASANS
jgi:hypothetical protein